MLLSFKAVLKYLMAFIFFLHLTNSMNLFELSHLDYDINQSKQFQKYCILTHCSRQALQSWSCKLCPQLTTLQNRLYIQNKITNVVGFLAYHSKLNAIIMIFRGTQDTKNWIQDFSYNQIPYFRCKNCKVHYGFYTAYQSVVYKIQAYIEDAREKYSNSKIYCIGSSLGAAISTIAALQAQVLYGNVVQLHVFGCPRVGDINFSQYLASKIRSIRRVIHNKDIVPHLPLQTQNFHHAAYQLWFNEDLTSYKVCNQSGEDPNCSNSLYPNYSIEDHVSYWQKPTYSQIC